MKKGKEQKSNNREVLDAIDHLAIIAKKGFDNASENLEEFRGEFKDFKKETNLSLFNLDSKVHDIDERLKRVEEILEPLFTGYKIMQKEIQELSSRIARVEKKAGIAK